MSFLVLNVWAYETLIIT